jgi:RNA polymerase sigma-70 factor (ECF subfamily)
MACDGQDLETLKRAVAGDEVALEKLLLQYHARLAGLLSSRVPAQLRSVLSVEDVLQETYMVVFREIRSFQPRSLPAFWSWLSRVAEHRLYDLVRGELSAKRGGDRRRVETRGASGPGSTVEWLEQLAEHERTPSRSAAAREALNEVRMALDSLPPDYREALRLRYINGFSVAQTAETMQRTEGAVCLLCHRALRRMHGVLGGSAEFFGLRE